MTTLPACRGNETPEQATVASIATQSMFWQTLLPERSLGPDELHVFESEVADAFGPITHARINIIPDGGVSRIRLFGEPTHT